MDEVFYWIGVLHVAVYALAAFSLATIAYINWLYRRMKLKADFLRIGARMFKERADAKRANRDG